MANDIEDYEGCGERYLFQQKWVLYYIAVHADVKLAFKKDVIDIFLLMRFLFGWMYIFMVDYDMKESGSGLLVLYIDTGNKD